MPVADVLASGSSDFVSSLGGILTGISELLLAVGAGVGFLIRSRRAARRERLRAETAATLAAQETRKSLEEKVEANNKALIHSFEEQLADKERQLTQKNNELQQVRSEKDRMQTRIDTLTDRMYQRNGQTNKDS